MNFWQQLPKPFFVLAPMDDVTDVAFRQIVAEAAPPDLYFTEFVSTDGLQSPGRSSALERLRIAPDQTRPLVAQIWGNNRENYYKTAVDLAKSNFSGIDINLGCPERSIVARGCCGGLIGQNDRVAELVAAVKTGAPNLPVSIKTRLGLNTIITEEWTSFLLGLDLAALTIHARTVREMSRVPAHWDEIAKVTALRDHLAPGTIIVGNGDILSRADGLKQASETGVDGVMIGRGIFHDLFAFSPAEPKPHQLESQPEPHTGSPEPSPQTMLNLLLHHLELYEQWGSTKSFNTLKKFFKVYIQGWPGAQDLRIRLMDTHTPDEARNVITLARGQTPPSRLQTLYTSENAHQSAISPANR